MTSPDEDFVRIMYRLEELGRWANKRGLHPLAFRRALITLFEIDTEAALERGLDPDELEEFDERIREDAKNGLKESGHDEGGRGKMNPPV